MTTRLAANALNLMVDWQIQRRDLNTDE